MAARKMSTAYNEFRALLLVQPELHPSNPPMRLRKGRSLSKTPPARGPGKTSKRTLENIVNIPVEELLSIVENQ